jgi:hypothetical protein
MAFWSRQTCVYFKSAMSTDTIRPGSSKLLTAEGGLTGQNICGGHGAGGLKLGALQCWLDGSSLLFKHNGAEEQFSQERKKKSKQTNTYQRAYNRQ